MSGSRDGETTEIVRRRFPHSNTRVHAGVLVAVVAVGVLAVVLVVVEGHWGPLLSAGACLPAGYQAWVRWRTWTQVGPDGITFRTGRKVRWLPRHEITAVVQRTRYSPVKVQLTNSESIALPCVQPSEVDEVRQALFATTPEATP
jgi:hypothetical protein